MTRLPEIANPSRKSYPSDLSDAEWKILQKLIPQPKGFGHSGGDSEAGSLSGK
jgi:hypothetical protein